MLKQIPKVVLLVALLAVFVASSAPALAAFGVNSGTHGGCTCLCFFCKSDGGSCTFDKETSQCVNHSCKGGCIFL